LITVNEEIAFVEGVDVKKTKSTQMLLMAMTFAVSMKLVGALLITGLMIIPASGARLISKSPEGMVAYSTLIGIISVLVGTFISLYIDWPLGPAIVVVASAILMALVIITKFIFKNN
jgi:zinc transport system permease protein